VTPVGYTLGAANTPVLETAPDNNRAKAVLPGNMMQLLE
jgi:hypothetical protein